MKIEQEKVFKPVTITLETPQELQLMRAFFGAACGEVTGEFGVPYLEHQVAAAALNEACDKAGLKQLMLQTIKLY